MNAPLVATLAAPAPWVNSGGWENRCGLLVHTCGGHVGDRSRVGAPYLPCIEEAAVGLDSLQAFEQNRYAPWWWGLGRVRSHHCAICHCDGAFKRQEGWVLTSGRLGITGRWAAEAVHMAAPRMGCPTALAPG